jgi:hypothetical protein
MAVSVWMYGSENWTLNWAEGRWIKAAEIKFLRRVSRHSLYDHEHSIMIRTQLWIINSEERMYDYENKLRERPIWMEQNSATWRVTQDAET